MNVRNENYGLLVAFLIMFIGCWITNWDPSDSTAQALFALAFVAAFVVSALLHERDGKLTRHRGRSGTKG